MFITIFGWLIILLAVGVSVGVFLKNEDGTSYSISQKILTIVVSVLVIFFGLYLTGHSKRVNEAKQESISSSQKNQLVNLKKIVNFLQARTKSRVKMMRTESYSSGILTFIFLTKKWGLPVLKMELSRLYFQIQ